MNAIRKHNHGFFSKTNKQQHIVPPRRGLELNTANIQQFYRQNEVAIVSNNKRRRRNISEIESKLQPVLESTVTHWVLDIDYKTKEEGNGTRVPMQITYSKTNDNKFSDMVFKGSKTKHSLNVYVLGCFELKRQVLFCYVQSFKSTNTLIYNKIIVFNNKSRDEYVLIAFKYFGFVIDPRKTTKLKFDIVDLQEFENELNKIKRIDAEFYYFIVSQEKYISDRNLMNALDALLDETHFIEVTCNVWRLFLTFLHKKPSAAGIEEQYHHLFLQPMKYTEICELKLICDGIGLDKYHINFCWFKSMFIRNMKFLLLSKLHGIVYKFIKGDLSSKVQPNKLTKYQIWCIGGYSLCVVLHEAYGSNMKSEKKGNYIRLTKECIIRPNDTAKYKQVPQILKYRNCGHMYIMTPMLYPVTEILTNGYWGKIMAVYIVDKSEPDFQDIIQRYQNNKSLLKQFKNVFSKNDLLVNMDTIVKIFKRYTFRCLSTLTNVSVEQLQLNEVGMSLRDNFKKGHIAKLKEIEANK